MVRIVIAMAGVWIALAQPAAAHARTSSSRTPGSTESLNSAPAMCGDNATTMTPWRLDALMSGRPLENDYDAQAERPRSARDRQLTGAVAGASAPVPLDEGDGQLAWCVSPDDPRCAPRDAGTSSRQGPSVSAPICAAARDKERERSYAEAGSQVRPTALGAPRAGVRDSLERPPRS